jgi:predicted PurR-regulated permease PerM
LKWFRWDKRYLYWGVTAFIVIIASITFFLSFSHWRTGVDFVARMLSVLAPVLYGLVFAYMLNKLLTLFENLFVRKLATRLCRRKPQRAQRLTRVISVIITELIALVAVGGILAIMLPSIYTSIESIVIHLPAYYTSTVNWVQQLLEDNPQLETTVIALIGTARDNLASWIQSQVLAQVDFIIANLTSGVIGIAREVINISVGVVISVYVLYHKEKFSLQSVKLIRAVLREKVAATLMRGIKFVDKTCGSFITSKLLDTFIVGVVCYLFMVIFRMPYAALISVLVGITNIIPFFGPFIGGVPSALLILLESPSKSVVFIIFIVILQQLDGNILFPLLQGNKIGLSGFWILFAILLFGGLFGFWGLMLGVPVFAVIYEAVRVFLRGRLRARETVAETGEAHDTNDSE